MVPLVPELKGTLPPHGEMRKCFVMKEAGLVFPQGWGAE